MKITKGLEIRSGSSTTNLIAPNASSNLVLPNRSGVLDLESSASSYSIESHFLTSATFPELNPVTTILGTGSTLTWLGNVADTLGVMQLNTTTTAARVTWRSPNFLTITATSTYIFDCTWRVTGGANTGVDPAFLMGFGSDFQTNSADEHLSGIYFYGYGNVGYVVTKRTGQGIAYSPVTLAFTNNTQNRTRITVQNTLATFNLNGVSTQAGGLPTDQFGVFFTVLNGGGRNTQLQIDHLKLSFITA